MGKGRIRKTFLHVAHVAAHGQRAAMVADLERGRPVRIEDEFVSALTLGAMIGLRVAVTDIAQGRRLLEVLTGDLPSVEGGLLEGGLDDILNALAH